MLPGCEILEARMLTEEGEPDSANRAVTLLADDNFGGALELRILVVNLVTIKKQDQVGILLDSAGFAQIRHHRALVVTVFDLAVDLRKRNHRQIEFLGQR